VLNAYLANLANLLQSPGAPVSLYSTANLTLWVNIARGQVAGESEAIRVIGTVPTIIGQRNYNFSSINIGTPSVTGAQGAIHVRRLSYGVASGQKWVAPRPWEWFDLYHLNNPVPVNGPPKIWSQYGAGSAGLGAITGIGAGSMSSGSFYIDPPPDAIYTIYCDCVCYPIALAADTDVEALPFLWTDAVSFFGAYYAYLSSQTGARQADAERMFGYYQTFVQRARQFANPSVNRYMYQQAQDPVMPAKLGLTQKPAGG
jgi:hypothetical protein